MWMVAYTEVSFAFYMGKPNHLAASEHIIQCALQISQQQVHEADALVLPIIELLRLGEEVCEVFWAERSSPTLHRLPIHAERLMGRLENWKRGIPAHLEGTSTSLIHVSPIVC
jgi:hypothetical protein